MNNPPRSPSHSVPSHHRFRLAGTLIALLAASALQASETMLIGKPRTPTDEATIRALEDESRRAVLARDYETLERIWSERFVVTTPGNFIAPNRSAVFDLFRRGAGTYSSYEKSIECIIFDGDVTIVMGTETVVPLNPSTTPAAAQRRYTNVWKAENGAWRLIGRQATLIPPGTAQPPAG